MKSFYSLLVAGTLFTHSAEGLLPPLYENIKEIQAILGSPEIGERLQSGEVINKIERTSNGFAIQTNMHQLDVEVVYQKEGRIGPASFKLVFGEPKEL